jgi:hypothetical protein
VLLSKLHGAVAFGEGLPEVQTCSAAPGSSPHPVRSAVGVRRFPFSGRGHHSGGALAPAVRSYRDVEELLTERGIEVDHVTSIGGCSGSPLCSDLLRRQIGVTPPMAMTAVLTFINHCFTELGAR